MALARRSLRYARVVIADEILADLEAPAEQTLDTWGKLCPLLLQNVDFVHAKEQSSRSLHLVKTVLSKFAQMLDLKVEEGTTQLEASKAARFKAFMEAILENVQELPCGGPSKTENHNTIYMQLWSDILQNVHRMKANFGLRFGSAPYKSFCNCLKDLLSSEGDEVKPGVKSQALQFIPFFMEGCIDTYFIGQEVAFDEDWIETYVMTNFPVRASELDKNSTEYTNFSVLLQGYLELMANTANLRMIKGLFGTLKQLEKHCSKWMIVQHIQTNDVECGQPQ